MTVPNKVTRSQSESGIKAIPVPRLTRRISELNMTCGAALPNRITSKRCKHVLLIVTGGTIAMTKDPKTGVLGPKHGFIKTEIRKTHTIHDKNYFEKYAKQCKLTEEEKDNTFVLPKYSKTESRIIYTVAEYDTLLDSSNMHIDDYRSIGQSILQAYEKYDGFVVVHGTDTMAYTASYLSFMFENLGKTVVLTGSQIPLSASRTDGVDNLQGAILIAGSFVVPEVTIFFHHKLFRGNRVIKADSSNFNAYESSNLDPLMILGVQIKINWDIVWRSHYIEKFDVFCDLNPNVGLLRLFPGITTDTVRAFSSPPIEGIAIQSYGAGNGPSNRSDILELLKAATDRGVLIINCTQCHRGGVSVEYETGKAFYDVGVVPGFDITPEAALAKLSYITGKKSLTLKQKKDMLVSNIRGELSKEREVNLFQNNKFIMAVAEAMNLSSKVEIDTLKLAMFPALLCAAAKQNNVELLQTLQSQGADLSLQDYDGRSALHIAVSEGHLTAVKFLLEQGASVHVQDRFGNTPLVDAIYFKQMDCVDILINAGAHISIEPQVLANMISNLVFEHDIKGIIAWHKAGVSLNEIDYENRSPMHVAVIVEDVEIVKYLLENGGDNNNNNSSNNNQDRFGHTPLELAENLGNVEIVNLLKK